MQTQGLPAGAAGLALQPTSAALPQGVVTRQRVVPAPPILVPQLDEPAADAERDSIVTIIGLAHAATAAWRRNLRRERPSPPLSRSSSLTMSLSSVPRHGEGHGVKTASNETVEQRR